MNTFVTPNWVLKEIGRALVNDWNFTNTVNRDFDGSYEVDGATVGDTVKARLPQRFRVVKGQAASPQPIENRTVDIAITDQAHIDYEWSSANEALDIKNYDRGLIDRASEALMNQVDLDGLTRMYKKVNKCVGTPGVVPGSTGTLPYAANNVYMSAVTKLRNGAVPGPYTAMLNPEQHQYLASATSTLFNPGEHVTKTYKSGQFGAKALGVNAWHMDNNVGVHTVGPLGGTPQVDGANQSGSTILTKGWTAAAANRLKAGDVINFAGVYEVNPNSYQSTNKLMDFVVTADFNSDGSGNGTIGIFPPLEHSGNYQNVTGRPADSANITIFGHASTYANTVTPQALIYHKDAFVCVVADLPVPKGKWISERIRNKALGISVRFLKDHSNATDQAISRIDILYGWSAWRPEMAVRVAA